MIPKIFHFIWIGDESKRPDNCIQTWRDKHPDWQFRLWGNAELTTLPWANHAHIEAMLPREFNGVADMMRWEILHAHGGVVFDADSVCMRRLDDHLLDCEAFACWENEIARPGLIAAGYFGCAAGNPFVRAIIEDIAASPTVIDDMAWKTVGPQRLTDCYRQHAYTPLRIYPSHYFIPKHFTGIEHRGDGPVYAHQLWGSTLKTYDRMHEAVFEEGPAVPALTPSPQGRSLASTPLSAPAPAFPANRSPIEAGHDPHLVRRVAVGTDLAGLGRLDVFASLCAGKRVLHVGCTGEVGDPAGSLHAALAPHCARLDGYDADAEALAALRPHVAGALFTDLAEATDSYDVVIVPALMGRVPDAAGILARLDAIDANCVLIAVPDAFQCGQRHFDYIADSQTFVELAHPDHQVWYTPYTLTNTIAKYSKLKIEHLWFFDETAILALLSRPALALAA